MPSRQSAGRRRYKIRRDTLTESRYSSVRGRVILRR